MLSASARLCFIIWMTVVFSGCSSILTYTAPLKSELIDGEKQVGNIGRYDYFCSAEANRIYLEKKPMCHESVMKMRQGQKELRCFTCSVLELAIFGLGLIDMIWAQEIIADSRKTEPLAEYDTGVLVGCGDVQPAAHEAVTIENEQKGIYAEAKTDANGVIDLDEVLQHKAAGSMTFNIRLQAVPQVTFKYVYFGDHLP